MAALATGFTQYSNMFKYYTLPFQKNEKKTLSANQIKRERASNHRYPRIISGWYRKNLKGVIFNFRRPKLRELSQPQSSFFFLYLLLFLSFFLSVFFPAATPLSAETGPTVYAVVQPQSVKHWFHSFRELLLWLFIFVFMAVKCYVLSRVWFLCSLNACMPAAFRDIYTFCLT